MGPARAVTFLSFVLAALTALALLVGTPGSANAQAPRPNSALVSAPAASAAARATADDKDEDEEAADSPRASMRTFLGLCARSRYEEAARYIDVPRGAEKRAAELARKLHDVLEERLWVDPERLSPLSQGKQDDSLPSGTEELGKVTDANGHGLPIRIVRHEARSAEDEPRWVFAQATVLGVEAIHASLRGRWVREHLPEPLLAQGPKALYYWQWLAIPVLALGCVAVGRLLTLLSEALPRRLTSKLAWGPRLIRRMRRPVTMGWALVLFWLLMPYLALTLRAEDNVTRVLRAFGYLAFFWGLVRAVAIAGDELAEAKWSATRPNIRAITGVGVSLGKVVVGALALIVALSELGYPVTTVIAGLGIGGVALALAAQKTVENLFGSVSILVDQPFGVGDTIRVDGVEGAVENIGLRSTRMRTVERTLVIIPNGKLADMRIESLGPRDRIRFSTKLALRRDTEIAQIEAVVSALRARVRAHPKVRVDDVSVRLTGLGEWSFDIEVAAPVETRDGTEFAQVREELLLTCVRVVSESGARLAVPARHVTTLDAE
jgi:MscS family membrane protein